MGQKRFKIPIQQLQKRWHLKEIIFTREQQVNYHTEIIPFELLRGVQHNCLGPHGTEAPPPCGAVTFLARVHTNSCQAPVSSLFFFSCIDHFTGK